MAILKDLTVYGATRLISDTFAANIYSDGFHHNAHNNDDHVLLAGGGHTAITTLLSGGFWANQSVQNISSTTTTPQFGKVMINTTSTTYNLNISGDSYATGWSRAGSGFYCQDKGVYYTHNGNHGEINVTSSNEFLLTGSATTMYFNYRAGSRGTTPTTFIWNGGSSTTYAIHKMKSIELFPTDNSSYNQGLRIHVASNNWSTIALCGADNTGASGTSANTWGIFNNNGTFAIAKNGCTYDSACAIGNSGGTWYINNRLTINSSGQVAPVTNYFNAGMYGNYASTRLGHIWSIGTSYYMSADGKNPNTTYGMLYFYTDWSNNASNNTANATKTPLGTYASGHQIGFFNNGVLGVSIGLNGNIWNKGYYITNISDQNVTIGSVYIRNTTDNYIRRIAFNDFITKIDEASTQNNITISKTLQVTEEWMDTGIILNPETFPEGTGTYAVQIYLNISSSVDKYDKIYSGIMSIYTGQTNGENSDEIVLHNASHASIKRLYLRTIQQVRGSNFDNNDPSTYVYNKLQIATENDYSTSYEITFKFKKIL